ncbi:MAG: FAD-dependent monooxygenase [Herpetosiphonaceae bacterium]|nr:FAD-dependent monooxygenase [Herpetosiphonaceae bacterium]
MKNKNILISGASIAGPALAYWLSRYGFNSTVVERAPALRDGGYAVDFRGAAHIRVLERMGILSAIQRAATNMSTVSYVDANNKPLARMPAEMFSGDVEILRGDLSHILYNATKDTTEYIFGDSIASMTETSDGVHVTFASGTSRTFDLIVGADGLHSGVRALIFGDESEFVRYLGYCVAIFTTANHLNLDHTGRYYSVPGKLVGMYSARHNTEAKALFFFASPPLDYDYGDIEQQKQILATTFSGEGWQVPQLLATMWQAPDFYFDSCSQISLDSWSKGRIVLLGDAGYCASQGGNGTGLAVVGAYILAGELAASSGDHRTAFAHYEQQMRPYVKLNQKQAEGGGKFLVPGSRSKIWLRNQMFRTLPYLPWKGLIAHMASKTANAITLKDYG